MPNAVVLLSGGIDSAVCLLLAKEAGDLVRALTFDYGQKCQREIQAARHIAGRYGAYRHDVAKIDASLFGDTALTSGPLLGRPERADGLSTALVPARNTVFLSYALAWSQVVGAGRIYIGCNADDYVGFPDCRQKHLLAFERMMRLGVDDCLINLCAPLLWLRKYEVIREGQRLNLDFSHTISCYEPDEKGAPCGLCDACRIRYQGFRDALVEDTAIEHPAKW